MDNKGVSIDTMTGASATHWKLPQLNSVEFQGFRFSYKKFKELKEWATPENIQAVVELLTIIKNSEQ